MIVLSGLFSISIFVFRLFVVVVVLMFIVVGVVIGIGDTGQSSVFVLRKLGVFGVFVLKEEKLGDGVGSICAGIGSVHSSLVGVVVGVEVRVSSLLRVLQLLLNTIFSASAQVGSGGAVVLGLVGFGSKNFILHSCSSAFLLSAA